ncbi:MAG: hypothetical protein DMG51_13375, partial [Acidobacteria bacterium]
MTWKRVATAALLIPFAVGLALWSSTAVLALALALVVMIALLEYFSLGDAIGHRAYRYWTVTCAWMLICAQWSAAIAPDYGLPRGLTIHGEPYSLFEIFPTVPGVLFLFVLGVAVLTLWTKRPLVEALPAAGISASGLILIAFPLSYALRLHGLRVQGRPLLLFALVITWVGDSAAYFVGRSIGKHALAPRLSPKKTWEGTVASFLGSLIVALIFGRFMTVPLVHLLGMAAVGNVAGQVGDLLESAYKRSSGIKDSGSLLPGHGGVLDRIDALIL